MGVNLHSIYPETQTRLEEWKASADVIGVVLVGSKAIGYEDDISDDDLEVILTAEAFARRSAPECHESRLNARGGLIFDALYTTLDAYRRKADSSRDLDHWPYESACVLFDRDHSVSKAVESAALMDPQFRQSRLLHATVDAWAAARRATKTERRGFEAATRLVVARGAKALSRVLFALEWRWVPLDHWLEPELESLEDSDQAGPLLLEAITGGKARPLSAALDRIEDRLYDEGVARPEGRVALFLELIHPSRSQERMMHGLY